MSKCVNQNCNRRAMGSWPSLCKECDQIANEDLDRTGVLTDDDHDDIAAERGFGEVE